jgi:hypothetical protein
LIFKISGKVSPRESSHHASIAMRQMGGKSRGAGSGIAKNRGHTHKYRFAMEGKPCAAGNNLKCGEKMCRFGGSIPGGGLVILTLDGAEPGRERAEATPE